LELRLHGLPRLVVRPNALYEETRYTLLPLGGGPRTAQIQFSTILLRITNDPVVSTADSIAVKVGATLSFYDLQGGELFSFDGRWGDTTQPPHLEQHQNRFDLLTADIPIGRTRELGVAIKYPHDEECYGVNNDSYGYPLLKNPNWRLEGEEFSVRIRVRGAFVDKTWRVRFRNLGVGRGLEPLDCAEV
jgi:hypothetical protein